MWSYFAKGGPVMWPLLVLSILAVVVVVWRWLALRAATRHAGALMAALRDRLVAHDPMGAVEVCEKYPGSVANIVRAARLLQVIDKIRDIDWHERPPQSSGQAHKLRRFHIRFSQP